MKTKTSLNPPDHTFWINQQQMFPSHSLHPCQHILAWCLLTLSHQEVSIITQKLFSIFSKNKTCTFLTFTITVSVLFSTPYLISISNITLRWGHGTSLLWPTLLSVT